ncbi:MAG: CopD family protein [Pseudomonadota bacterium]
MAFLWFKVFHILFVIAWMAGLLMYPRLKIYQLNGTAGDSLFTEMQLASVRLRKIIMTPALIGTWVFGLAMVAVNPAIISAGGSVWFPLKFLLVIVLSGFHGWFTAMGRKIDAGMSSVDGKSLRMLNEVPFVLLIAIVILVIIKPF